MYRWVTAIKRSIKLHSSRKNTTRLEKPSYFLIQTPLCLPSTAVPRLNSTMTFREIITTGEKCFCLSLISHLSSFRFVSHSSQSVCLHTVLNVNAACKGLDPDPCNLYVLECTRTRPVFPLPLLPCHGPWSPPSARGSAWAEEAAGEPRAASPHPPRAVRGLHHLKQVNVPAARQIIWESDYQSDQSIADEWMRDESSTV